MEKEFIKKVRVDSLLTQLEFSKIIGVDITTIQRWEWGVSVPSFKYQRKILEFCKQNNIDINKIKGNKD